MNIQIEVNKTTKIAIIWGMILAIATIGLLLVLPRDKAFS